MVTFSLSSVEKNTSALPTMEVMASLQERGFFRVEAASTPPRPYLHCQHIHSLVIAVHTAFQKHYPLIISPDDIWLCIAQGLARHINLHAEQLRPRMVHHQGAIELKIRRDEFVPGSTENDWPGVLEELCEQVKQHMGNRRDLFIADFSTTDRISRAASQIVLLGGVQQFFTYLVGSLCGIPEITLLGTPEDWSRIKQRVEVLREFDLGWWVDALAPIVQKIEETARNQIDKNFWLDLYKLDQQSGGERITGWINALFPYLTEDKKNPWFDWQAGTLITPTEEDIEDGITEPYPIDTYHLPTLKSFPSGLTQAPFTWEFPTIKKSMSFAAGFFGVIQEESGALRAQTGWAVVPAMSKRHCTITRSSRGILKLSPHQDVVDLDWLPQEVDGIGPFILSLWFGKELRHFDGLRGIPNLVELDINSLGLTNLDCLSGLTGLKTLFVSQCAALEDIRVLSSLPALEELSLGYCPELRDLDRLSQLKNLQVFAFGGSQMKGLSNVNFISGMTSLKRLHVHRCEDLEELNFLSSLSALESLEVGYCPKINDLQVLSSLPNLKSLSLTSLGNQCELAVLGRLPRLSWLVLSGEIRGVKWQEHLRSREEVLAFQERLRAR